MSRRPRDLAVLKMLAAQRTLVFTATASDITPKEVRAIAAAHGALRSDGSVDGAAAGRAVVELEASLKAGAIPQRDGPASPRRATFPAAAKPSAPPPAPARPATPPPAPAATGDVLSEVAVAILRPDPGNPRDDVGDVAELAASIKAVGLLQPIVARRAASGQLFVVAGHRRLQAVRRLGWTHVQVIVRRDMRPDDVLAAMLVENSHRKDLDPIEEARALRRLQVEAGMCSHADLARRIGRTQVHVSGRLALLALPIADQEALRAGQMSLGEAVHNARVASGRVKPKGQDKGWHLGPQHELGVRAKARCRRLQHARGRSVGGMACGECWESVIRADERDHLNSRTAANGACALCDTPIHPAETTRKAAAG